MEVIFGERPIGAIRTGNIVVDTKKLTKWVDSKIGRIYYAYREILEEGAGEVGINFITDCVYAGIFAKTKGILKQEGQGSEIQDVLEVTKIDTFDDFKEFMKSVIKSGLKNIDEIVDSMEEYSKAVGINFDGLVQFIQTVPREIIVPALYIGFYTGFLFASENPDGISLKKYFDPYIQ